MGNLAHEPSPKNQTSTSAVDVQALRHGPNVGRSPAQDPHQRLRWDQAIEAHRALLILFQQGIISKRVPAQLEPSLRKLAASMGISERRSYPSPKPQIAERRAALVEFDRALDDWQDVYELLRDEASRRSMESAVAATRKHLFTESPEERARLRVNSALAVPGVGVVEIPAGDGTADQWQEVLRVALGAEPRLFAIADRAKVILARLGVATPVTPAGPAFGLQRSASAQGGSRAAAALPVARAMLGKVYATIAGIEKLRAAAAKLDQEDWNKNLAASAELGRHSIELLRTSLDAAASLAEQVAIISGHTELATSMTLARTGAGVIGKATRALGGFAAALLTIENAMTLLDSSASIDRKATSMVGVVAGGAAVAEAVAAESLFCRGGGAAGFAAVLVMEELRFISGQFGEVKTAFARAGLSRQLGDLSDAVGGIQHAVYELEVASALVEKSNAASERSDMIAFQRAAAHSLRLRLNDLVELALSDRLIGTTPGKNRYLRDRLLSLSTIAGAKDDDVATVLNDAVFCVRLFAKVAASAKDILREMVIDE